MSRITSDRWRVLMPLLDEALALAPADRAAWLADLASREPDMALEVDALLRQHASLDERHFLEPSSDVIQRILGERAAISLPFQAGDLIGSYQLVRPLGSGGMGVVWLAQQISPIRRLVALKIARPGPLPRELLARLEAERQALAILDHPGISKVFEAGSTRDGIPYFVMEYIDGAPITEYCDSRALTVEDRLRLFTDVCDAVHHAHGNGVLHRDLKPKNILVSEQGDRHAAKIIDFGIAKAAGVTLTEDSVHTQVGAILGTPAYMSPEQAGVIDAAVDERTDVYSLGVILHELLSGGQPAVASKGAEDDPPRPLAGLVALQQSAQVQRLASNRSTTPAVLHRHLTSDLQWIVATAIRRTPVARYTSVAALRADIMRHLDGQPIEARAPSHGERLRHLVRRNRTVVTAALVLPVAVASGALVSSLRDGETFGVRPVVAATAGPGAMPIPLTSFPGVEAEPAWSPDGREVAFAWNGYAQDDFDLYVLRLGESEPRRLTTAEGADLAPAWSPDGRWIAYQRRGSDGQGLSSVHLVSPAGAGHRVLLSRAAPVGDVEWSRDGAALIVNMVRTSRRVADLWTIQVEGGAPRRITRAPDNTVGDMGPALSPDGRTLAFCRKTAWRTAEIYLLDVTADLAPVGEPRQATNLGYVDRPVWTPDGSRLLFEASGSGAGIWQLEVATGRVSPVIGPPDTASQPALVRRADGHTALAFTNQLVEQAVWRYAVRDPAAAPVQLVPSSRSQFLPQFSNDGARVAFSSTRSGSPEIWIANVDGSGLRQITTMRHPVTDMGHWSPDDRLLTFVAHTREGRRLYFIEVPNGKPEAVSPPDIAGIGSGWSRDGRFYYYTSTRSGRREVWRVDRADRSHQQMTSGGADRGFESGTGTFYYWALSANAAPVLRRRSSRGDEAVQLTPRPHPLELTVTSPRGFYYRAADTAAIYHYDETAARASPIVTVPRPLGIFTISPGGDFVAGSFLERETIDLMLIERFR